MISSSVILNVSKSAIVIFSMKQMRLSTLDKSSCPRTLSIPVITLPDRTTFASSWAERHIKVKRCGGGKVWSAFARPGSFGRRPGRGHVHSVESDYTVSTPRLGGLHHPLERLLGRRSRRARAPVCLFVGAGEEGAARSIGSAR